MAPRNDLRLVRRPAGGPARSLRPTKRRKIAEPDRGEYAEPEEKEQDEDGKTPEEPDVDPDDRAHRTRPIYLAERHREPDKDSQAEGSQDKAEGSGNA